MRRAAFVVVVAMLAAAGLAARAQARPATSRLNVVFNVSGNAVMKDVQRLIARHGVTFDDFRVTTSMCGPSRASILTGQYAHHTGVLENFGAHAYPAFVEESEDLPVWMHDAGYETALVGKYINGYTGVAGHHKVPPGWNDWQVMDSIPMEAYYNYDLNDNGTLVHYGNKANDYSTS